MFRPSRSSLVVLALALGACSAAPPFDARAVATEWVAYMQRDYVLRPLDRLSVRVDQLAGSSGDARDNVQEVIVSPTGTVDLRRLPGPLQVGGKSMSAARTMIIEAYKQEFSEPRISVSLTEAAVQSVYVCGEVRAAGAIPFQPGMTMTQAIAAAGSFHYTVNHDHIRIIRISPDGTQRNFQVNMEAVFRGEQPDFLLLPGDVIYCETSGIADAGNWVDLWIRRLLPFQLGGPALGTIR
ncbi:MAG: polysaccharide biosynthesis/export family protein [Planctomycetes bacterium]|nr:polysaccharide biosynthesis/export family protein [Planctomycetota bacterium]